MQASKDLLGPLEVAQTVKTTTTKTKKGPLEVAQTVKTTTTTTTTTRNPPVLRETWVRSLGWEDPLEEAWQPTLIFFPGESPWTEEPDGLQSIRSQRVGHD